MAAEPVASVQPAPDQRIRSRRSVLRAGLAGLAGLALGALGRPASASAAAGGPIVMGAVNDAGTSNTTLTAASTGTAFQVNQNSTGTALRGIAGNGIAGFFTSVNGSGVSGVVAAASKFGVYGANDSASHGTGAAIRASGKANSGLVATTANGASVAVYAQNSSTGIEDLAGIAIVGLGSHASLSDVPTGYYAPAGQFVGTNGVVGTSPGSDDSGFGVAGFSAAALGTGVFGLATELTSNTYGVYGEAASVYGCGVAGYGSSLDGWSIGVLGMTDSPSSDSSAIMGQAYSDGAYGMLGVGSGLVGVGVYGIATADTGVCYGLYGNTLSPDGYALYCEGPSYMAGDLTVTGTIITPAAAAAIDHPLDPANKVLSHSFVQSPDMLNVYSGTATLDAKGEARVALPAWFEAVNTDLRYQLTAIGTAAPALHVKSEVEHGSFAIAGGVAGQKVSWLVAGIRDDGYARAHRTPVEAAKPKAERGRYLHPAEAGRPEAQSIGSGRAHARPGPRLLNRPKRAARQTKR